MKLQYLLTACAFFPFVVMSAIEPSLPEEMQKIMHQPKYDHAIWGLYVKDIHTGKILYDINSNLLFSPASTTKLFSVASLLHAFGNDYRFKTPVYANGSIRDGVLNGDLILIGQGDFTMGGRQSAPDKISFTKMDHIVANSIPGVILTKEDPLKGIYNLAQQVYEKGIRKIKGEVVIDDTLFETTEKRGMILSPVLINENLIDIIINSSSNRQKASLTWRPMVQGYHVENQVETVSKGGKLDLNISSDESGRHIVIKGTIPEGEHDIIRTFSIKDPVAFAKAAFKQALENQGISFQGSTEKSSKNLPDSYQNLEQVALWTSPPLSEYGKLILKVSHNLGADLVPLLLASQKGKKTFDEGMRLLGEFVGHEVKLSPNSYVFIDAAGGNENRLTPQGEAQLLEYIHKLGGEQFQQFYDALPILGVDGSLADVSKETAAAGKVRAKTGTGVSYNLAAEKFFLITEAMAGYIEGKDGHLLAYMLVVNNAAMPAIEDVFPIFEEQGQISNIIYTHSSPEGL